MTTPLMFERLRSSGRARCDRANGSGSGLQQ
jgi:hypothetical protein